jgi:hypothetical protein
MSIDDSGSSALWSWRGWRDGVSPTGTSHPVPIESVMSATMSELDERMRHYSAARSRQLGIDHYPIRDLTLLTLWSEIERHAHEMSLRYAIECYDDDVFDEAVFEAAGTHIGDEIRRAWAEDVARFRAQRDLLG